MDTVFMNSKNSNTFEPYRLLLNLSGKLSLKRSDKYFLYQISASTTNGKMEKYKNVIKKPPALMWNEQFKLPDRSYSVSDIQDMLIISSKNVKQKLIAKLKIDCLMILQ